MGAIGGPIEEITVNGRRFSVAADADGQRKIGGFENEHQSNGDGGARTIKTRVPWMLSDLSVEIDDSKGDQEFLQNLADGLSDYAISVTFVSGQIYQGTGQISGELTASSSNATMSMSLSGPGKMTPQ